MTKTATIQSVLISELIRCKYTIYSPLFFDNTIVVRNNKKLEICFIIPVYTKPDKSKYLRLLFHRNKKEVIIDYSSIDVILAVDVETKTVWKLPYDDISACKFISLDKRWSSNILRVIENSQDLDIISTEDIDKKKMVDKIKNSMRDKKKDIIERKRVSDIFAIT